MTVYSSASRQTHYSCGWWNWSSCWRYVSAWYRIYNSSCDKHKHNYLFEFVISYSMWIETRVCNSLYSYMHMWCYIIIKEESWVAVLLYNNIICQAFMCTRRFIDAVAWPYVYTTTTAPATWPTCVSQHWSAQALPEIQQELPPHLIRLSTVARLADTVCLTHSGRCLGQITHPV